MSHIHTLKLHQLRLGELSPAEEGPLRTHLAECALCASRANYQHTARNEFQRAPMPAALEHRPSWWERMRGWLPAAALVPVALAGAFALRTGPPAPARGGSAPVEVAAPTAPERAPAMPDEGTPEAAPHPAAPVPTALSPKGSAAPTIAEEAATPAPAVAPTETDPAADVTHSKGLTTRLEAWVQTGTSARPLYLGETVGAGTKLQLRYDPQGRRFVTLAGRDSNGIVEVYGTVAGGDAGLTSAPFALTLDASKGEQAFFALCTDERPTSDAVMSAVKHNPVRMQGAVVASVVVRKD